MCCRCNSGDHIEAIREGSVCTGCKWHKYRKEDMYSGGSSTTDTSWTEIVSVCTWPNANAERVLHVDPVSGRVTETMKGYRKVTYCHDHRKGACGSEAKFFERKEKGFDLSQFLVRSGFDIEYSIRDNGCVYVISFSLLLILMTCWFASIIIR